MLDPTSRILLADELTPPRGFRLSRAVGTSFTLDLTAALSIPMAFTAAGLEEEPEKAGIIGALMGVSERIDIFAQSGAWSLTGPTDLVTLLEPALHPVNPIRGIFHPKIWLMEFTDGEAHRYRMISSSRNLTFDHSWDTLISIDGAPASGVEPADQRIADPLAELVEYMIGRSRPGLPEGRRRHLLDFATRLRHTVWDVDQHFDLTFHVLGLPGSTTPDFTATHTLVASPFVTEQGLRTITDRTHQVDLISRTTTLDGLSTTSSLRRSAFRSWVMDGQADDDGEAESDEVTLTGLHAKVISCAFDHRARLFIGSANATEAAWNRNVEVMVELEGRRHELGPDAIRRSLASMLVEYPLSEEPTPEVEEDGLSALEHRLHRLAAVPFGIAITGEGPYRLTVTRDDPPVASTPEIGKLTWHLLSREDLGADQLPGDGDDATVFDGVELTDITAFVRLTVESPEGERRSTVLMADLMGDPPGRRHAVVARQLRDPSKLIELLMVLLDINTAGLLPAGPLGSTGAQGPASAAPTFPGLLETLLQALAADAEGLDEAKKLVEYVMADDEPPHLPPNFLALWEAAWQAHRQHSESEETT